MTDEELPGPDQIPGAPHPRDTPRLFGQDAAEAAFLEAFGAGRLHHAWLITGPKGVGKATLAWRIARFLMTQAPSDGLFGAPETPNTLETDPELAVNRRVTAGSEPGVFALRRGRDEKSGRLRNEITVDETRKLRPFFGMSATDGGRRVVIVDAADEMNTSAANAFLKLLEEPPTGATLLLVSHQPARLLPTIRSRCRELRGAALGPDDLAKAMAQAGCEPDTDANALSELSGGSVGTAITLANEGGAALYARIAELLAKAPRIDRPKAIALAEEAGARGAEAKRALIIDLIERFLARAALTGAGQSPQQEAAPNELAALRQLAPDLGAARIWAEAHQRLLDEARHGLAVNLDPVSVILDMVLKINETAATVSTRR